MFWEMVHKAVQKIIGYDFPKSFMILYLGNFTENDIKPRDRCLVKVLLIAGKKAITRKWGQVDIPTQGQWMEIVEEIYIMDTSVETKALSHFINSPSSTPRSSGSDPEMNFSAPC